MNNYIIKSGVNDDSTLYSLIDHSRNYRLSVIITTDVEEMNTFFEKHFTPFVKYKSNRPYLNFDGRFVFIIRPDSYETHGVQAEYVITYNSHIFNEQETLHQSIIERGDKYRNVVVHRVDRY